MLAIAGVTLPLLLWAQTVFAREGAIDGVLVTIALAIVLSHSRLSTMLSTLTAVGLVVLPVGIAAALHPHEDWWP